MSKSIPTMADFEARLDELQALPEDWDSYGAIALLPSHREEAVRFIKSRFPQWVGLTGLPDEVVPEVDGGVQLEWYDADRKLIAEFNSDPDGILFQTGIKCQ